MASARKRRVSPHKKILADNRHLYDEILESQGGTCALCPNPPRSRELDLDHDHKRLVIRGLLCHRCNRALPAWITEDWLLRAAKYIGRTYLPRENGLPVPRAKKAPKRKGGVS